MKPFLFVLSVFVFLADPAAGQPDVIEMRFKQLDTNGDGKLSAEELQDVTQLQTRLKGADKNGDGLLTLEEVQTHLGQPAAKPKDPAPSAKADPVREAPKVRTPNAAGIGRMIPDISLKTLDGKEIKLKDLVGKNGLVVSFTNTTCPICKKYGPTLTNLEETLIAKGVNVVFVNPTSNEKSEDMKTFVSAHKLKGPYVHDIEGTCAKTLGATSTAEVFLLDKQRTVIYRGAFDDQYGLGYSHDTPKRTFLLDAITALLSNRAVDPAATTAPGCELDLSAAKSNVPAMTYHNRISRIVQANCVECHRTGGVAPFSLEKYEDVVAHSGMIRKVVEKGTMPPWFATPAAEGKPSSWANDRTVPAADKADLFAWLKSDRPKGDEADAPLPRTYADGWLIGKPDAVFEFPKGVAVKANGTMPYQNITVETKLTEDKWVKAVEVRPSAREVVHHVLVFVLPAGKEDADDPRDAAAEERKGFFAIYVPGQSVLSYPDGFAKRLPKGSRLRFQMHYTPNGKATEDKTRIGLVFSEKSPQFEVKVAGIVNPRLSIPPGADNHAEPATLRVPTNATALGFLPHMHLRGKAFRYEITLPGGKAETVLDIPHYDFNWQLYYRLAEPRLMTAGTTVKATGWYDNSDKNPANPDPKKTVRWGPQTTDEMMLGYLEYYVPAGSTSTMASSGVGGSFDPGSLFKRVDSNSDGKIARAEYDSFVKLLPRFKENPDEAKALFERLDGDKDGMLTPEEFKKLATGR
jgi:peroxiredoxin/Ca2+-binding EF-hand superfamily protein/mono/diheme cytochrome c family protein